MIAQGLKEQRGKGRAFPNFANTEILLNLARGENTSPGIKLLACISFTFSLRVTSETIPIVRAEADDDLLSGAVLLRKAVIGIRRIEGVERLALKIKERKNNRNGEILTRGCICGHREETQSLRPIHGLWPIVARRCRMGRDYSARPPQKM